jgi:hypothetical protein
MFLEFSISLLFNNHFIAISVQKVNLIFYFMINKFKS